MATDTEVLALHRYFVWAGRMRVDFETELKKAQTEQDVQAAHFIAPYLPYWYAGTYVLVEGWRRLGLTDPDVDALLDAEHLKLLEAFRHGVYHFHPEYYDERFRGFWAQGRDAIEWTNKLWSALNKFFVQWINEMHRRTGTPPPMWPSSSPPP